METRHFCWLGINFFDNVMLFFMDYLYLLSDFNNVKVIELNSWTETISLLFIRHITFSNLSSKLLAPIFILTSILFYPFMYILGKLVNSDYICHRYGASGDK